MGENRSKTALAHLDTLARYAALRSDSDAEQSRVQTRKNNIITIARAFGKQLDLGISPDVVFIELYKKYVSACCGEDNIMPGPHEQRNVVQYSMRLADWVSTRHEPMEVLFAIQECLDDIASYLPWDVRTSGLYHARDIVDAICCKCLARQPIKFTRIIMGGDKGPCDSEIIADNIKAPVDLARTALFGAMCAGNPEEANWCAIYTTFAGNYGRGALRIPTPQELSFLNYLDTKLLSIEGVVPLSCGHQIEIPSSWRWASLAGDGKIHDCQKGGIS